MATTITEVRAVPLAIPLRQTLPPSPWAGGVGKQVLVRITTGDGPTGWGECFAYGAPLAVAEVVDGALAPLLVGQDPTRLEALTQAMHRALMIWGRRGLGMHAVSGVELALWDLAGKLCGVPVSRLLGGECVPRVRAYASLLRYATPSDVGRACANALAEGYTAMKLHQTDVESVAVAREVVGDRAEIMLDTNCPWSVEDAIRVGRELEPYHLRWFEEPVWPPEDYEGLARVRAAVRIPIATGENDATVFAFRRMIEAGAADVLQPSATKVGGLGEMRKIAVLAAAHNVTLVPHCFYFGPGLAATLQFAAATPGVALVEMPPAELEVPILAEPPRCRDGWVAPSTRPGLGADPNPEALARYPYERAAAVPFYLT